MPMTRRAVGRRRFSEMHQGRVGVVGLVLVVIAVGVCLRIGAIRDAIEGGGHTAEFAQAAGLVPGDDVRVAGMTVGTVHSVGIDGTHVDVRFSTRGIPLGDRTTAVIKTDDALGGRYLALEPAGAGDGTVIPLSRTTAPPGVTEELGRLTTTVGRIDVAQLSKSFDAVSGILEATPHSFRQSVRGVGALSRAVSRRDASLRVLLQHSSSVTGILAQRRSELIGLMTDGSALFSEIQRRRTVVHSLLVGARLASVQLGGLMNDNRGILDPALTQLRGLIATLDRNKKNLEFIVQQFPGFLRGLGEAVGSGPFFAAYVDNLAATNLVPLLPTIFKKGTS